MKHYKSPTNEIFAYELDGSQDHLIPSDYVLMTEEETNTLRTSKEQTRLQAELDAMSPLQKRAIEYPSIGDQLDMLYHDKINNTNTWQTAIEAVKTKYPKA